MLESSDSSKRVSAREQKQTLEEKSTDRNHLFCCTTTPGSHFPPVLFAIGGPQPVGAQDVSISQDGRSKVMVVSQISQA